MIFSRQKLLLALLNNLGGKVSNLDFQKLLFLYCQEVGDLAPFEFVPYKFGAFSFTSYADRRKLVGLELLSVSDNHWELTEAGRKTISVSRDTNDRISEVARRYRNVRGDDLVAETYRRYPYYAVRSEIADRVLKGDTSALGRIKSARPKPKHASIATLGYEGRTLEGYLNILLQAGINLLCDVRNNPISRKYGFSKGALSSACKNIGICYEHLPELGIVSERRKDLDEQEDYDRLFRKYERDDLPKQGPSLEKIRGWVNSGSVVALTCFERMPHQCHRHCVSDALEHNFGAKFTALHL
jgi:hypothetical protein